MTTLALLVAAFVASLLLLRYVMRVPRDFPFRSMLMMVAVSALLGFGGAAAWRGQSALRGGAARAALERDRYLAGRPADSLAAYVAPFPGATVARASDSRAPAGTSGPEGGQWMLATDASPSRVIAHYRTAGAEAGWTVEASAADFLVLRRAVTAVGARGAERLRITARRGRDGARAATLIEHALSRRF